MDAYKIDIHHTASYPWVQILKKKLSKVNEK